MLVLGSRQRLEEDEMYPVLSQEVAAQRIADLHREAAAQRLARELRGGRGGRRRRSVWGRLVFRQPRPAGA
jgi:hypothetical protein